MCFPLDGVGRDLCERRASVSKEVSCLDDVFVWTARRFHLRDLSALLNIEIHRGKGHCVHISFGMKMNTLHNRGPSHAHVHCNDLLKPLETREPINRSITVR